MAEKSTTSHYTTEPPGKKREPQRETRRGEVWWREERGGGANANTGSVPTDKTALTQNTTCISISKKKSGKCVCVSKSWDLLMHF